MQTQTVGDRIEMLCDQLDISRRKFADKIEENPSTIASIVRTVIRTCVLNALQGRN